ncbi:MAG: hypothetical protein GY827_12095 [Cytophagales bacterium]|nr:hypothetical protein [Cytophagales bacterium]
MNTKNHFVSNQQFVVAPHIIQFNELDTGHLCPTKRKNYPQKNIYMVREFLTKHECEALIKQSKKLNFQQAGLAIGQDVYRVKETSRNNKRVIFEDKEMAKVLWNRFEKFADRKFKNHHVHSLNWRFRVYEYSEGDIFAPHIDERMDLGDGMTTLFTFMIYLNEDVEGGETTFFDPYKGRGKNLKPIRKIRPRTGMVLAFDHLLFHEGSEVTKGKKYVLRSDIIYKK